MTSAAGINPETGPKADATEPEGLLPLASPRNRHEDIPAEATASLERLLAYEAIRRAPRLRGVLKFMVDSLLDGTAKTINEQKIGEVVFGRPAGYSPGEDNIVRVTIRHLRERVEEFYQTSGANENYVFQIPKGKYVPILSSPAVEQVPPSAAVVPEHIDAGEPAETHHPETANAFHRYALRLSGLLVGVLGVTVAFLGFRLQQHIAVEQISKPQGILSLLLANRMHTTVVVTDSNLEAYRMIFRKTVPLDAYLQRTYLNPGSASPKDATSQGAWTYTGASGQTSMTSVLIATEIQAAAVPQTISIKYPHDLSLRDIKHANYIFLGGPWVNPWEQLFESHLNFRIVPLPDKPWLSNIYNAAPLPSEQATFALHNEGSLTISYVRFVLLRNQINDGGYIILLSGTSEEATEEGASFLMSEPQLEHLLKTFKVSSPEQLPSLEVVIETAGLQNIPKDFRVVAERVVHMQ